MFFENQQQEQQERYILLLKIIGALSKLSSDDDKVPYLYYRMAENIFCKSFNAKNLARSDISFDATKGHLGIGLKTFLYKNGRPIEKIAEFNKDRGVIYQHDDPLQIAKSISELRNKRLILTGGACDVDINNMIYHCVVKQEERFLIYETKMNLVNIDGIKRATLDKNTIKFNDGVEEYTYNVSKSTLFKRFIIEPSFEIDVKIFNDPYQILEKCLINEFSLEPMIKNPIIASICLPLYSERGGTHVPERSGLNQWNANGRPRNSNEVYIPIPSAINRVFPDFFPPRDTSFTLLLPNGRSLVAKVCQDGNKALMSDPNSALGEWLLRDVLRLESGELLTYNKLEEMGIDSVEINKFEDGTFEINFKKLNSFENFKRDYL